MGGILTIIFLAICFVLVINLVVYIIKRFKGM